MTLTEQLEESIKQVKSMKQTNGVAAPVLSAPDAAGIASLERQLPSQGNAPDVYRAICEVARALSRDGVSKDSRNQQQGYSFRGIDAVMNALSAPLAAADLCILPRMLSRTQEERTTAKGGVLFYVTVHAHFAFVSARDGSRHTIAVYGEAMDSGDKATNKAMSAAYKYACMQAFCIPTEAMADADQSTPEPMAPGKAPSAAPPANSQAAADAVAAAKIAAGNPGTSKPWSNRGEMRKAFAALREQVGEVDYLTELARYGVTTDLNWKTSAQAIECWHHLDALRKAVA